MEKPSQSGAASPPQPSQDRETPGSTGFWARASRLEGSELEGCFVLPKSRGTAFDMIFGGDHGAIHDSGPFSLRVTFSGLALRSVPGSALRVSHLTPTVLTSYPSPPDEAELATTLETLLDEAIDSATRTGTALDRLSQTFEAFHDWTLVRLGTRVTVAE